MTSTTISPKVLVKNHKRGPSDWAYDTKQIIEIQKAATTKAYADPMMSLEDVEAVCLALEELGYLTSIHKKEAKKE